MAQIFVGALFLGTGGLSYLAQRSTARKLEIVSSTPLSTVSAAADELSRHPFPRTCVDCCLLCLDHPDIRAVHFVDSSYCNCAEAEALRTAGRGTEV